MTQTKLEELSAYLKKLGKELEATKEASLFVLAIGLTPRANQITGLIANMRVRELSFVLSVLKLQEIPDIEKKILSNMKPDDDQFQDDN